LIATVATIHKAMVYKIFGVYAVQYKFAYFHISMYGQCLQAFGFQPVGVETDAGL